MFDAGTQFFVCLIAAILTTVAGIYVGGVRG
jgi:hypothetical protein